MEERQIISVRTETKIAKVLTEKYFHEKSETVSKFSFQISLNLKRTVPKLRN